MIAEWDKVEATFASTYQISSAKEMFGMSWRRFRVLFLTVFNWSDSAEDGSGEHKPGQGQIASTVDWGSAKKIEPTEVPDLITQFQGKRIGVGSKDGR